MVEPFLLIYKVTVNSERNEKMAKINTKYKDRLFRLLFGEEEYKENILSLYNAIRGTDYTNVDDIKIYTIDDVIYIEMKVSPQS